MNDQPACEDYSGPETPAAEEKPAGLYVDISAMTADEIKAVSWSEKRGFIVTRLVSRNGGTSERS